MGKRKRAKEGKRKKHAAPPPAAPSPATPTSAAATTLGTEQTAGFTTASTLAHGRALAERLLDNSRTDAAVVVSVHPDADGPWIDLDEVARELDGSAELYIASAEATFGLSDGLGSKKLSVFYGAGRVYPTGDEWTTDMYAAPLHMCLGPDQSRRATADLVTSALSAAHRAGAFEPDAPQPADRPAEAVVKTVFGHQAMLLADCGQPAAMSVSRLRADVEPERLLRPGIRLQGRLRGTGPLVHFLPDADVQQGSAADGTGSAGSGPTDLEARVAAAYRDGDVVLAKVSEATADSARVLIHPDFGIEVLVPQGADVGALLEVGDVLPVEVSHIDGQWLAVLAEGESVVEGIAVLPGGPAWLQPSDLTDPNAAGTTDLGSAGTLAPAPTAATIDHHASARSSDVAQLQLALAQAQDAIAALDQKAHRLELDLEDARGQARAARASLRKAERRKLRVPVVHDDPIEQLRLEVRWAYLLRVRGADRLAHPWPDDYAIGGGFVRSMESLEGVSRDKVTDVMAEVLCGLDKSLPGRELHPWLDERAGRQQSRADGAMAWRVSLQVNTPGARRLKYWRLPGGLVEFDSVGHHDQGLA